MRKEVTGFRLIFGYLGLFLMLIGGITLFPLIMIAFYRSEWICYLDFLIPGGGAFLIGALLYYLLIGKRPRARFERNEDSALLVLLWIAAVIIGALPFYISGLFGEMDMTLTEAIFESTSAYATTGLSVFKGFLDVEGAFCPHVFLFHRSFMQFIGGVGLVLLVASVLRDRDNLKLYLSEGHNDKLLPSLGKSAKLIFGIYFGYIALGTLAFWLAGMDVFDALNHAMCALSTAGFSTRSSSLAWFEIHPEGNGIFPSSPLAIEIIAMVLMLLGAISFVLHTFLLTGKFKKFFGDSEIKFGAFVIVLAGLVCFLSAASNLQDGWTTFSGTAFRRSFFSVISSITTTGFSNCSIGQFNDLGRPVLFIGVILMTIGGGVGSTAGGIKQYRVALVTKDLFWSLRYRFASPRLLNPKTTMRYGEFKEIDPATESEAHHYSALYLGTLLLGIILCCFVPDFSVDEASYEFASALSGTGLSVIDFLLYRAGHTTLAYNYLLWVLTVAMFIGRLEIMPIFYSVRNIFDEMGYYKKERKQELAE